MTNKVYALSIAVGAASLFLAMRAEGGIATLISATNVAKMLAAFFFVDSAFWILNNNYLHKVYEVSCLSS
jgi:hypothetical protein